MTSKGFMVQAMVQWRDPPPPPGSLEALLFPDPVKQAWTRFPRRIPKYDAALPSFISIVRSPSWPSNHIGRDFLSSTAWLLFDPGQSCKRLENLLLHQIQMTAARAACKHPLTWAFAKGGFVAVIHEVCLGSLKPIQWHYILNQDISKWHFSPHGAV